jgi:hypothetical protein
MVGANYLEVNLKDLRFDHSGYGKIVINGTAYSWGDGLQATHLSLGRVAGVKLLRLEDAFKIDKWVVVYTVGDRLISFFECKDGRFTPDDGLTLINRLKDETWYVPYTNVVAENTKLALMTAPFHEDQLRLGVLADVPHIAGKPCVFYATVECADGSLIVLPDKDSTLKTEVAHSANPLDWVYNSIKSSAEHVKTTLQDWVDKRWVQLSDSTASLDECLKVVEKVGSKALDRIDLDKILTAHKMASPSDRWPMYRKQANTPYSRLELLSILADHAKSLSDDTKFKIMAEAGSMLVQYGDLELRPSWVSYQE